MRSILLPKKYGGYRWLRLGLLVVGLILLARTEPVAANGGTTVRVEQIGGYEVTITASPYPLEAGVTSDVSALVGRLSDSGIELEAEVTLTVEPLDEQGAAQTFDATHDNATNKLYYASNVIFPTPGRWRLTVQLEGPEGSGSATFIEQVQRRQPLGSLTYPLIGVVIGAIMFFLAVFLGRRSKDNFNEDLADIDS